MKEILAHVSGEGHVIVPAEVLDRLAILPHGTVTFVIEDSGQVRLRPVETADIASLRGAAGALGRPLTWEQIRQIARADRVAEIARKDK